MKHGIVLVGVGILAFAFMSQRRSVPSGQSDFVSGGTTFVAPNGTQILGGDTPIISTPPFAPPQSAVIENVPAFERMHYDTTPIGNIA